MLAQFRTIFAVFYCFSLNEIYSYKSKDLKDVVNLHDSVDSDDNDGVWGFGVEEDGDNSGGFLTMKKDASTLDKLVFVEGKCCLMWSVCSMFTFAVRALWGSIFGIGDKSQCKNCEKNFCEPVCLECLNVAVICSLCNCALYGWLAGLSGCIEGWCGLYNVWDDDVDDSASGDSIMVKKSQNRSYLDICRGLGCMGIGCGGCILWSGWMLATLASYDGCRTSRWLVCDPNSCDCFKEKDYSPLIQKVYTNGELHIWVEKCHDGQKVTCVEGGILDGEIKWGEKIEDMEVIFGKYSDPDKVVAITKEVAGKKLLIGLKNGKFDFIEEDHAVSIDLPEEE